MKQLAYLLITTFIIFSCKSEKYNHQSDLQASNLKGKVWKVEKTIHNADEKITTCPCGEREDCKQALSVYNEKGNLDEYTTIDIDGKILVTSRYSYDRNDLCKEIHRYSGEKLVGKELNIFRGDKLIEVKVINADEVTENVYKYEYSGNEVSDGTTLSTSGEIVGSFHNEYSDGQLDSQTKKDNTGNITVITKYKRNTHNDVTESIYTNHSLNSEYKLTFDYEYDSKGNWIKQTQLYNGKIVAIIMRNITYYNS